MTSQMVSILSCPSCKSPLFFNSKNLICSNNHQIKFNKNIVNLIPENFTPELTVAQKSGAWKLTSFLYERIWRLQSLSIMTAGNFSVKKELALLKEFILSLQPESVICDLTCSTGVYGRFILNEFPKSKLLFLDYSETMLLETQRRNKTFTESIYIQNFAENKSFIENSLDGVVCGGSWNEITKSDETLAEVYSSLKPGGRTFWMGILKSETKLGKLTQKFAASSGGLHFDSSEIILNTFRKQGFQKIKLINFKTIFILTAEK